MNKKILFGLFLAFFIALFSGYAFALDVSIDRVRVNGKVISESSQNLIEDADVFSVLVDFTAVQTLEKGHVEAILRGRQSGDVVSDSTAVFDLAKNHSSTTALTLNLIDSLKRETEFDLTIKIVDAKESSEQETFGIKTKPTRARGVLDVSIDRVKVNDAVIASSKANFIDESNDFDVLVEFTALEDLEDAHAEAILRDLRSNFVVADATSNFDLDEDLSSSRILHLELLDKLKQSDSFELTVKIVDAEGDSIQKTFGLRMKNGNVLNGVSRGTLDVSIDSIEVEKKVVVPDENNFVIIDEGQRELDVRVRLTSLENAKDVHIDAILTFENGEVVADATTTFDIAKDANIARTLEIPLISKFEQNNFKLKIRIADADGDFEEKVYGLKISQKKFPFVISSISLDPESNAEAGKNIVARVVFHNSGVVPLNGITAKVSIPELGISSTKFIDQLKTSGDEVREDFVLKILDASPTGTYTLRSEIASQFGSESEVKEIPFFILGKSDQTKQIVNDKLVINVPTVMQTIYNDGSEVLYPLVLTNLGPDADAYSVLLDGASWADLRLSESNVFVLSPKETKTINVLASTKSNLPGEQIFIVTIKSSDKVLKQIPLKGDVVAARSSLTEKLKAALKIVLIIFVVFLVMAGLLYGAKKYIQGNKDISEEIPEQAEGEAYY